MTTPLITPPLMLYDAPEVAVYAVYMLSAAALAALVCRVISPFLNLPDSKTHVDMALRTTAAVVSALTLTLAFCAIQARTQQTEAQRVVAVEVAAIGGMGRQAVRLGQQGVALHAGLTTYLRSIIDAEFPQMAVAGRDSETQRLAEGLEHATYVAAAGLADALAQDLLQELDEVGTAREERLRHAGDSLPGAFWTLIRLLMLLLLATGTLYPPKPHVLLMLAIQAAGVAALVAFVFLMDRPFRGHLAVSAAPYQSMLINMTHRAEVASTVRRGLLVAEPPAVPAEAARLARDDPHPPVP
ncbi:DUF4239 domain-containing protein [Roseomonas frigidaquae]|uniref:DUF4239 domain-containing protein n=1 Tax=Falsiroseomonas frigidaquae TaxID=487318 RepID=A0ABX1F470_9PROT|nr:DUF4239 domain-containing protein [Falsiroseomonas frigidaquae]NKE47095.1 DUF4239 domain-containing protein [Falsiroseomonas frigidaquae]